MYSTTRPLMLTQMTTVATSGPSQRRNHQVLQNWSRVVSAKQGHCIPLWAVLPLLQVVLSSACSVASLSRCPSHHLPGHPHLRGDALADCLFGRGSPSTWRAGHTPLHDTPSVKPSFGAGRNMTPPRWHTQGMQAHLPQQRTNANGARPQASQTRRLAACWEDLAQLHSARTPIHQDKC
jgi:hypothetical protein